MYGPGLCILPKSCRITAAILIFFLQWFVDNNDANPGDLVLYRTLDSNDVDSIEDGGAIAILQEQDEVGR